MDQPVQLIPLICLKCQKTIPAQPGEVAWVCTQCGQGMQIDENQALKPLEVYYSDDIPPNVLGKPYWVSEGSLSFQARHTYTGNEDRNAQNFWSQPRRFFIPAFEGPLETLLGIGSKLLEAPPDLQAGRIARFESVILSVEDVKPMAEFIVMALEAGRKDKLREIQFSLELSNPVLWILP